MGDGREDGRRRRGVELEFGGRRRGGSGGSGWRFLGPWAPPVNEEREDRVGGGNVGRWRRLHGELELAGTDGRGGWGLGARGALRLVL